MLMIRSRPGWRAAGFGVVLMAGLLSAGCQRQTPPATDSKALQKHAEELKKQLEREMKNK
jgi:hypothetical protein